MNFSFKRSTASLALLIAHGFAARPALAQEAQGFASNRFEPAERGSEWFYSDSLDFRGHLRPSFGATLDYAYRPLVVETADGASQAALVENQLFAHIGGSLVLWERLRVSASLPVALYQSGSPTTIDGVAITPPDSAAVGDLRLAADVRLLGEYRSPFSLAVGMRAWLPTGSRDQFTGDGTYRLGGHVMGAGEISIFSYAARIGLVYRDLESDYGNSQLGTDLPFSVAAGVRLLDGRLLLGPELNGSTVLTDGSAFLSNTTPLELLFGGHFTHHRVRFGAGAGPGLSQGIGSPEVRSLLSIDYVHPAPKDSDGDGFTDDRDRCPNESGPDAGCPATLDSDNDSIIDSEDACPREAGSASTDREKNGCPVPPDRDADGIPDEADRCPEVAAATTDGCPAAADVDQDSILDEVDACPSQPGPANEDPKQNGCPIGDADGDGVQDDVDACPNEAGAADAEKPGCPLATVVGNQVSLQDNIEFEPGSANILSESDTLLKDIGRAIETLPEGGRVRIEGHTDSVGTNAANRKLGQARAEAVRRWLIERGGIAEERLEAIGIGEESPIASNDTPEGRAKNRRVEFHLVNPGS